MALQLPLDIVPNTTCHGAYAAYRVSTSYTGPTMNIRRSSDNATSDFYASPHGQFGTTVDGAGTSLESWLGASVAYVVTWYDQSGKGNHATQTTALQQPIFDSARYRISFTSGTPFFNLPSGTVPQNTAYTVTMKHNTIAALGTWLSAGGNGANTNQVNSFRRNNNNYVNYWYANDYYGNDNVYNAGNVVTYAYDGSYSYVYINGTPQGVSPIRSGWNGQPGNEYIGRAPLWGGASEYFNGEMYYLFIFKSYLETNERNHIERGMSIPNTTVPVIPIKFSQISLVMNSSTSSISLNQVQTYLGAQPGQLINVTPFNGIVFRSGLFMRIYWNRYHGNDPTWFNSNTPNITGVTTTLKNTYCATGGFNNPNTSDTPIGGLAATITYSVEWAGLFFAPVTGTYTFYLASDDSSYLWVGNTATSGYTTANSLINNFFTGAAEKSATISLTGGTYYPFRLQFGDGGGGEFITFSFAPPSGVRVYEGTGYFFCPSRNVSASSAYQYIIRNGSTEITTYIQGTISSNPATSGYAIYSANPWLPNGYYWIKSAAMPNALQMFVDIKNGGFDFYQITGGTSVNYITQTHSGIALGLELMIPRSQTHWKAIYQYVHTTLASNYDTWMVPLPIYKTTAGGNYTSYAMFDPRYGNSGSTAGSYNGAPDWRCKDGGLWYLRHIPHGEPNGDYTANAFLGAYSSSNTAFLTSYGAPGFNDGNDIYYTGTKYIVSTNYAGSTVSTLTTYFDGSTFERAAPSALYIKNQTGATTNGVYWINLPTVGPTQIYCIMDSTIDGGGWMMAMKATRGTTFPYTSGHWTTITTLNPSDNTRNDADAKFNTMNYFPSKDILALWPDIPYNYASGTGGSLSLSGYNNWCWMKNNYNTGTKQTLINYFSTASNVSFMTGTRSSSWNYTSPTTFASSGAMYNGFQTNLPAFTVSSSAPTTNVTVTVKITIVPTVTSPYSDGIFYWGLAGQFEKETYISNGGTSTSYQAQNASYATLPWFTPGGTTYFYVKTNPQNGSASTFRFNVTIEVSVVGIIQNTSVRGSLERGTAFSSQAGNEFYGVNFTSYADMKVRWGFGWNNEADWGSNDVMGGIGMSTARAGLSSFSAGDQIACCQDNTGINRSARVEMYIR